MKNKLFIIAPGFFLAIFIGLAAWWISGFYSAVSASVIGIVLGIIIRFVIGERKKLIPGILYAPKFFIPMGIILYGTNLRFDKIMSVFPAVGLQLTAGIIIAFITSLYLGRKFGIGDKSALLIAAGNSICGASAIAIITPIIKSEPEDTSSALIFITIFGLIGMLIYPLAPYWLGLSDTGYALLCGTTLPLTGMVKTAVAHMGNDIINFTLAIKMARATMIIPVILFLCRFTGERKEKSIIKEIPWFIWAFILTGALVSFIPAINGLAEPLKPYAEIFFTIALTSIGLTCEFKRIINSGGAPMIVTVISWIGLIVTFFIGHFLL